MAKWRPQWTLRGLALFVTAVCVLGAYVSRVAREDRCRQALIDRGFVVTRTWSEGVYGEAVGYDGDRTTAPEWLDRMGGAWLVDRTRFVQTNHANTDDELALLSGMRSVEVLFLKGPGITDKGVTHLFHLTSLRCLILRDTRITDSVLPDIGRIHGLVVLEIGSPLLTDSGLRHLIGLLQLRKLTLRDMNVISNELGVLRGLPSLERLCFDRMNLHSRDISWLGECHRLWDLTLSDTAIDDSAAHCISNCRTLLSLDVSRTNVSDEFISRISGMPKLYSIFFEDTRVSDRSIPVLLTMPSLHQCFSDGSAMTDDGRQELWSGQELDPDLLDYWPSTYGPR